MRASTIRLLKKCNAGCKNATNSMKRTGQYVKDAGLKRLIAEYDRKHVKLGDECHRQLGELGVRERDPSAMTKLMTKYGVDFRMTLDPSPGHAAEMMIDGCGMGIKTVSRYMNRYASASDESLALAGKIVKTEKEFMDGLLKYL